MSVCLLLLLFEESHLIHGFSMDTHHCMRLLNIIALMSLSFWYYLELTSMPKTQPVELLSPSPLTPL